MSPILHGDTSSIRERPVLESQIELMRLAVQVRGECIVPYDELSALCAHALPPRNQWEEIAKVAIDEGLEFHLFPRSQRPVCKAFMTLVPLIYSWCFFAGNPQWRTWTRGWSRSRQS